MQKYKEFSPTGFDPAALCADSLDIGEFLVFPVSINRDTQDTVTLSNWGQALEALGGESETVQVHRFGHWGPGWFEIMIIDPRDEKTLAKAEDLIRTLEDYPVLDETHLSELEHEKANEAWADFWESDFRDALKKAFGLDRAIDYLEEKEKLPELRDMVAGGLNWTWEHDTEGARFNLDGAIEALTREDVAKCFWESRKSA